MDSFETYELDFGTFKKFDRYILGIPNKYSNLGIPEARKVHRIIGSQFTQNYGYIGDRINHHSVDPTVYLYVGKESPLLKSVAIIVYSESSRTIAELEEQAANTVAFNFGIFDDLESAVAWTLSGLDKLDLKAEEN
ncbi:MAG: hypothetical protein O3C43_04850 [Verrucomicrobia bacterium]|nr:hypothetical protein [Verrucomicrobiota bacterium]MDA1065812.1 hypothetical protein [Verrucomicrobiota bacterium]